MVSLTILLLIAAIIVVILAAIGRAPLWVGVLLGLLAQALGSGWPR